MKHAMKKALGAAALGAAFVSVGTGAAQADIGNLGKTLGTLSRGGTPVLDDAKKLPLTQVLKGVTEGTRSAQTPGSAPARQRPAAPSAGSSDIVPGSAPTGMRERYRERPNAKGWQRPQTFIQPGQLGKLPIIGMIPPAQGPGGR